MASASNNPEAERAFNRAQLKLNLNLPSIDTPKSLTELQSIAEEIQRQKDEVLCHLKLEDKERHSYFTQLEHLARQMRELPLPTDSPSLEYELERKRLELETQRMQDTMLKTLGPTSEVVRRREERIVYLRKLDQRLAEINGLIVSKEEAASEDHNHSDSPALPGDWTNDKDIWDKHGDTASVMSFTSSIHSSHAGSGNAGRNQKAAMRPKVEVVYNLLTMLFSHDRHNVSKKLLQMSANPETRNTLHQVGCIPLLVQLIYNQDGGADNQDRNHANSWMLSEADKETRASAAQALHNLVYNSSDDRKVKREIRILKLLELIRGYADRLRDAIMHQLHHHDQEIDHTHPLLLDDEMDSHPCPVVTNLMKLSFDDDHRQAMSHLGALQGLSELLHLDQLAHGSLCDDAQCTTLRRYASMTLTNLTFGHGPNKALLCSTRPLLTVLSHQLASPNDDLRQVTASVLRNLSWRADSPSKEALQQTNVVQSLITVAMETHRESTLKSMLSALWNLSSHSSCNKAVICATPGSLEFLVRTLTYKSESKTLSVVESGGGILRNISSHIATRDDYRSSLRRHGCFPILLHHLRSPSLTVVSNACGTLWNLSARCKEDQSTLRELGAVPMLRSLVHSRHKLIATASSAALKNLDSTNFSSPLASNSASNSTNSSLQARKQKALEQEIDQTLTEMCDNIDPLSPLDEPPVFDRRMYRSLGGHNTTSQYGRPSLLPKSGSAPIRQARSSSLERKQGITPSSPAVRWRTQENEISYTSLNYEEDDQPVNYSLKYTEEVPPRWTPAIATTEDDKEADQTLKDPKKVLVLSAYRETDLDEPEQPTDFSLRYQEDDDYAADSDTMQTYCLEGTPYETPFTGSSAVSLTDLRDTGLEESKPDQDNRKQQVYGTMKTEAGQEKKPKSEDEEDKGVKTPPMPQQRQQSAQKEAKTVTFNTTADSENNYAEQTPLMFSRSSSLESLDSIEQHQNCHDEGSVVSEFSRLTSRAVSPSELPDSPGQTMPSSPRQAQTEPKPKPIQRLQEADGVFEDSTNDFGMEGTPAFTRAASPLSQLSFDENDEEPTQAEPVNNRPVDPPQRVEPVPIVNPAFNRVMRSSSEVNFRSTFDYDEPRRFNEEDSPALTRCTSLSSLHIDGEVISTAKLLPVSHAVGNLASAHLTERKVEPIIKVDEEVTAAPEAIQSAEWSEESGSEDDVILESIISLGMPRPSKIPKSASAHSLGAEFRPPASIPASKSTDCSLSKAKIPDSVSEDDDDDEMLYACIKSAKPTAKPIPPPRTSSISGKSASNGAIKNRPARPPMELPKPPATKERVPPLHGPYTNVRQMAVRTKSSSEVASRPNGRRSRHSSQGSSRMGASGCSNNTSVDLDYRYSYKVEDTPVCFSRNSSLSSLSVNSNDDEPSAEDQALLDSCISWGMPKSKSDNLQTKKSKPIKTNAKLPASQSWGGGVRKAGDGQASQSGSSVTASSSFSATAVPDVELDPPSMTHSSLIRLEANQVAAQIQSHEQEDCNDLEHVPSLTASLIDGAASWTKSPSLTRKSATPLLKLALSRQPETLACSVLEPSYFDDEQRREGLLSQLAIMEQTVDENANTDNGSVTSSSSNERRKLTPRDRRQADKERYQTYTLNANAGESSHESSSPEDVKKKQRRSEERYKTQTISKVEMSASQMLEIDAKVVIRNLKEEAKLTRKNSNSSELISEDCLLDCETLSLVSNESESDRSLCLRVKKMTLHQDGLENTNEDPGMRKTKVVRPEDKLQEDSTAIKGIRGRRRVLCPVRIAPSNGPNRSIMQTSPPQQVLHISPPKSNNSSGKSTPVSRAAQQRGRSASPASPSPVRPNRTSALRQKSKCPSAPALESQVRLRTNSKSPRVSSAPCSPRQPAQQTEQEIKRRSLEVSAKNCEPDAQHPPLASLGKQGTFTKEKSPEAEQVKVPPKVPPKPKPMAAPKPALPKKPARFNNGPSPLSSPRSKGSPALSRRSVSSASIGSDSTTANADEIPAQKRTPPKKVVASKIASLWKQVEDSRNKQKSDQPDVRKWISRGDKASAEEQPQRPLVSSGTFEKLSSFNGAQHVPVVTSPASDKRSPPSRLPFRLPRFGRSSSQAATPTTPTLPTPPSPGFDSADAEDKRKFRVTAL